MNREKTQTKTVPETKGQSKYKKSGTTGIEGVLFQVNLLTMVMLNAFENFNGWKLSTEDERYGKFDDVVLELADGVILLQAKHRKNKITFNDLLSTNTKHDDFSLAKYFLSYQEIKTRFQVKYVVVCTNADINIDKSKKIFLNKQNDESEKSIVYHQGCFFYTFNSGILPTLEEHIRSYYGNLKRKHVEEGVINTDNIEDFLNHLRLYTNYPSEERLNTIIEQIFTGMKYTRDLCIKTSSKYIHDKVLEWFRQCEGIQLEECHFKAMISEISSYKYREELAKYDVHFRNDVLDFTNTKQITHVVPPKTGCLLNVLKIYKALPLNDKILYVSQEDSAVLLQQAVEAFEFPKYTHLIVIWSYRKEDVVIHEINSKLRRILNKRSYKKVILIAASNNKLAKQLAVNNDTYTVAEESVTFNDLSADTQSKIIKNKDIVFQGNDITLEELFPTEAIETCQHALDQETLEKMIRTEKVKVGSPIQPIDDNIARYYIHRNFTREIPTENDANKLEVFSEADIHNVTDKLIVIADVAGMGKTTVLANLATTIKDKFPDLWVLRVELNYYTRALHEFKKNKQISIVDLLQSINHTQLNNHFEVFTFSMIGKVILMLDGMDEVSPDCTELILNLIIRCQEASNFRKIFITCRTHMTRELTKRIPVLIPFTLEPFTEQNQIDFLTNYWTHNLKLDDMEKEKCKQYSKALITKMSSWIKLDGGENHFMAIPLQVRMLADIFQDSNPTEDSGNWKGCQEYVAGERVEANLPDQINISKLYAMFIDKKKEIFKSKGNSTGNAIANQALEKDFEDCLNYCRMHAVKLILSNADAIIFFGYLQDQECTAANVLNIGIIQTFNENVHFIHRTFAEYFLAQVIFLELKKQSQTPFRPFQNFFFDKVLYYRALDVVRVFLNDFIYNEIHSLPSRLLRNYQPSTSCVSNEPFMQRYMIHQLSFQGHVGILQLVFKHIHFKVVKNREVTLPQHFSIMICKNPTLLFGGPLSLLGYLVRKGGVNIRDEEDNTPLHCAARNGHLKMVKYLVEQGASINMENAKGANPLGEAVFKEHINIIRYLLEKGSDFQKRDTSDKPTVINFAIRKRSSVIIKLFVEHGMDLDMKIENNNTLLHLAIANKWWDIVNLLMEHHAKVNVRNNKGYTALHLAVSHGTLDTVKRLLEYGADVRTRCNDGEVYFQLCALWGHTDADNEQIDEYLELIDLTAISKVQFVEEG